MRDMVIRFPTRPDAAGAARTGVRLLRAGRPALTAREIAHREQMLRHLAAISFPAPPQAGLKACATGGGES